MKREHSRWRARALADLVRVQATSGAGVKFANPLKGGKIECYYCLLYTSDAADE